jgi:hypothetical protein
LVVDLDVEYDVAGVHTGDSNVDAVGLTGIRQFALKPNAQEEPVRSRTQCVPNTKRTPRRNQETATESDAMTTICVSKRSSPASLRRPPSTPVRRAFLNEPSLAQFARRAVLACVVSARTGRNPDNSQLDRHPAILASPADNADIRRPAVIPALHDGHPQPHIGS